MNMLIRRIAIVIGAVGLNVWAFGAHAAEPTGFNGVQICKDVPPKMPELGYTRGWISDYGDGTSGCATSYYVIPGGSDTFAFYAGGLDSTTAKGVWLAIFVHDPTKDLVARTLLADGAATLIKETLHTAPPSDLVRTVLAGKPKTWDVKGYKLELQLKEFPKGREYRVVLRVPSYVAEW